MLLGKYKLPFPLSCRISVLFSKSIRHGYTPVSLSNITLVDAAHLLQMSLKRNSGLLWKHGQAILGSFAVANSDLIGGEVYIFNPQAQTLHQPESGTVHQECHELFVFLY